MKMHIKTKTMLGHNLIDVDNIPDLSIDEKLKMINIKLDYAIEVPEEEVNNLIKMLKSKDDTIKSMGQELLLHYLYEQHLKKDNIVKLDDDRYIVRVYTYVGNYLIIQRKL